MRLIVCEVDGLMVCEVDGLMVCEDTDHGLVVCREGHGPRMKQ